MHTSNLSTKEVIRNLANEWGQFRDVHERQSKEAKRGQVDPLTNEHLQKLSDSVQDHTDQIQRINRALQRPGMERLSVQQVEEEPRYIKAFCEYLRKGQEQELAVLHTKSILGTDKEAGYNTTTRILQQINVDISARSPIRKLARITQIAGDVLELLEDGADALAGWSQDLPAVLKDTAISQLYKKSIPVHELYAQPKATQRLLEDPIIDIESWLATKVTDVFIRKENAAFINGDGLGKPRGILNYDKSQGKFIELETGEPGKIITDSILKLVFALPEIYAVRGKFLLSREVIQAVRLLKHPSTEQYLWQPSMIAGTPDTLFGIEVVLCSEMPGLGVGNKILVYADFEHAYQVVDRGGVRVLRDPYTEKPYTKFYTTKRVGGDLVDLNAIRVLVAN